VDGVRLEDQPSPQELKLLVKLYEYPGEVVPFDDLIAAVWGRYASEQDAMSLRKLVGRLRARLDKDKRRFVHNERGRGYRLEV
jgi:DNA-binding response OmpR family regulator